MASIQTCENESIVEHPTQLLKQQNSIRYLLHGMNDNEQAPLMQMINEMRQRRDVHEYVSAMEKIRERGERKVSFDEDNRDVVYEYFSLMDKIKEMKIQKLEDHMNENIYPPPTFQSLSKIGTVSNFNEWLLQEDTVYIGCHLKSQISFKLPWIECCRRYEKIENEELEDFYRKHYYRLDTDQYDKFISTGGDDVFLPLFGKRLGCFCEQEETCNFSVIKKICDEIRDDYMIWAVIDILNHASHVYKTLLLLH